MKIQAVSYTHLDVYKRQVLGDVAPIRSFSPTPKLFDDSQIESFRLRRIRLPDAAAAGSENQNRLFRETTP